MRPSFFVPQQPINLLSSSPCVRSEIFYKAVELMSSPFCTDLDSESKWRRLPTQFQFHKIVHVEASLVRNALAVNFTRVFRARVQMRTDISPENAIVKLSIY